VLWVSTLATPATYTHLSYVLTADGAPVGMFRPTPTTRLSCRDRRSRVGMALASRK
jgi:hypothetical protein